MEISFGIDFRGSVTALTLKPENDLNLRLSNSASRNTAIYKMCNTRNKTKTHDPARTRTWNTLIRSQLPYPLGHGAFTKNAVFSQRALLSSFGIDKPRL